MKDKTQVFNTSEIFLLWAVAIAGEWDWTNPLNIKYGIKRAQRSVQQNSLYWMWLTEIEEQNGTDKEDLHDKFKYRYAVPIFSASSETFCEMIKSVKALRKLGLEIHYQKVRKGIIENTSTTDFTVPEMTAYLNKVYSFAVIDYGYQLTHPNDRGMDWLKIEALEA